MPSADPQGEHERKPIPAEFQYLFVVIALFALLLLAGLPGNETPEAGEGTGALRQGWAEKWTAHAQEQALLRELERDAQARERPVEPLRER